MSDKHDEEKFREIDDSRFDNIENNFFTLANEADEVIEGENFPGEILFEMLNQTFGLVDNLVDLLPADIKEYAGDVIHSLTASSNFNFKEANRLLHKLQKHPNANPALYLQESKNLRQLGSYAANTGNRDEAIVMLKKEKKALREFMKRYEESGCPYGDYLYARAATARIKDRLGEEKGIFVAFFELPANEEFFMEDLLDALQEFYDGEIDDDDYTDCIYTFQTDKDNVVDIELGVSDEAAKIIATDPLLQRDYLKLMEKTGLNGHFLSIMVDTDHDIFSAAMDLQQVIAACYACYPDSEYAVINDRPITKNLLDFLLSDARAGYLCEPIMYAVAYDGDLPEEERVLRTFSGSRWGRMDIGIMLSEEKPDFPITEMLISVFSDSVKKPLKPGDKVKLGGHDFTVHEYNDHGYNDILLLQR